MSHESGEQPSSVPSEMNDLGYTLVEGKEGSKMKKKKMKGGKNIKNGGESRASCSNGCGGPDSKACCTIF